MKKERLQQIKKIFEKHEFIAWKKDIIQANVTEKEIQELITKEIIWENYQNVLVFDIINTDEFYEAQMYSNNTIFHSFSAMTLHDLSNYVPHYHFFIQTKNNANHQNFIYSKESYSKDELEYINSWFSRKVLVTNLEKTVIDVLKGDTTYAPYKIEVIENYLFMPNKNLKRLKQYANKYHVDLSKYL